MLMKSDNIYGSKACLFYAVKAKKSMHVFFTLPDFLNLGKSANSLCRYKCFGM